MDPRRFAEGFSKTPWTHPWGLSHKIPLVRVSKSLLRITLVAARTSFLFKSAPLLRGRKSASIRDYWGRAGGVFSKPHKRDLVRQSPGMGSRRLLNTPPVRTGGYLRSEEHTSELQSRGHLVCRLL